MSTSHIQHVSPSPLQAVHSLAGRPQSGVVSPPQEDAELRRSFNERFGLNAGRPELHVESSYEYTQSGQKWQDSLLTNGTFRSQAPLNGEHQNASRWNTSQLISGSTNGTILHSRRQDHTRHAREWSQPAANLDSSIVNGIPTGPRSQLRNTSGSHWRAQEQCQGPPSASKGPHRTLPQRPHLDGNATPYAHPEAWLLPAVNHALRRMSLSKRAPSDEQEVQISEDEDRSSRSGNADLRPKANGHSDQADANSSPDDDSHVSIATPHAMAREGAVYQARLR